MFSASVVHILRTCSKADRYSISINNVAKINHWNRETMIMGKIAYCFKPFIRNENANYFHQIKAYKECIGNENKGSEYNENKLAFKSHRYENICRIKEVRKTFLNKKVFFPPKFLFTVECF